LCRHSKLFFYGVKEKFNFHEITPSKIDGFSLYPKLVLESKILEGSLKHFEQLAKTISPDKFRVTLRTIVSRRLINEISKDLIEAILPLDGDLVLVCLGENHPSRALKDEKRYSIQTKIAQLAQIKVEEPSLFIERVLKKGFALREFCKNDIKSDEFMRQLFFLQKKFFKKENNTLEFVLNPNNRVFIALFNNNIVSTAATIAADFNLRYKDFRFVELTFASTHPEYEKNNLLGAVTMLALCSTNHADLIIRELNSSAYAVLKNAAQQGSVFAMNYAKELGLPDTGILIQDTKIENSDGSREYQDLVVAFVPKKRHQEILKQNPYEN